MVRKKRQLSATVAPEEYAQYDHEAARHGIDLSELIRKRMRQEPLPPIIGEQDQSEDESEEDAE